MEEGRVRVMVVEEWRVTEEGMVMVWRVVREGRVMVWRSGGW